MTTLAGTCPLSQRELIEQYFVEHRTMLLDIAAFLDRLDRARELDSDDDFRLVAFRQALEVLTADTDGSTRMQRIQMLLSDPRSELLPELDRKSAFGAYGGPAAEAR